MCCWTALFEQQLAAIGSMIVPTRAVLNLMQRLNTELMPSRGQFFRLETLYLVTDAQVGRCMNGSQCNGLAGKPNGAYGDWFFSSNFPVLKFMSTLLLHVGLSVFSVHSSSANLVRRGELTVVFVSVS